MKKTSALPSIGSLDHDQGQLLPFKIYFSVAYYLGYCPFKIIKNPTGKNSESNKNEYCIKTNIIQKGFCFVVAFLIAFTFGGATVEKITEITQGPQKPIEFFNAGYRTGSTILRFLNIAFFWFYQAEILNIFKFLSFHKNSLPVVRPGDKLTARLRIITMSYVLAVCIGNTLICHVFTSVDTKSISLYFLNDMANNLASRFSFTITPVLELVVSTIQWIANLEMYDQFINLNSPQKILH